MTFIHIIFEVGKWLLTRITAFSGSVSFDKCDSLNSILPKSNSPLSMSLDSGFITIYSFSLVISLALASVIGVTSFKAEEISLFSYIKQSSSNLKERIEELSSSTRVRKSH